MQFDDGQLVEQISAILERYDLPPQVLELELTESILLRNLDQTMSTLNRLKDKGVHLAIDDFGTGYSALNYLKDFPIDTLKIDRSFVMDAPTNPGDQEIIKTIIAMAHNLRLDTVAEGVETDDQIAMIVTWMRFGSDAPPATTTTTTMAGGEGNGASDTTTTTAAEGPSEEVLALGRFVYDEGFGFDGCQECHGLDANGSNQGPSILGASRSSIVRALKGVPDMEVDDPLTQEEIDAVWWYITALTEERSG